MSKDAASRLTEQLNDNGPAEPEPAKKTKKQPEKKRRNFQTALSELQGRVDSALDLISSAEAESPEVQKFALQLALCKLRGA